MKKILLSLLILPLFVVGQNKATVRIAGNITQVKDKVEWVYFSYLLDGEWKTDSIQPKKGKFNFKAKIEEPQQARLRVRYFPGADGLRPATKFSRDYVSVFLEKGKIKISSVDSFSNAKVTGSQAHDEFLKLTAASKPYNDKLDELYKKHGEHRKIKDNEGLKSVEAEIEKVQDEMNEKVYAEYARNNPNSPLALHAVKQYAGWDIDPDKAEPMFNLLPKTVQAWPSAVQLKELIDISKKTGVGRMAMDFTQNDTLGIPVSLSSFRGKYVLVDFWASWCGPCRVENPNVVKAFHKYKDKGFYIVGVSLDRPGQKDKWLKAIHDDQLTWTHVSDLKFWDNEVAKQYGIRAIPQNLLIGPEGKILAKNLRGDELDQKLGEVIEGKKAF